MRKPDAQPIKQANLQVALHEDFGGPGGRQGSKRETCAGRDRAETHDGERTAEWRRGVRAVEGQAGE